MIEYTKQEMLSDDVLLEAYVWLARARAQAVADKDEPCARRIATILTFVEMRLACGKGLS